MSRVVVNAAIAAIAALLAYVTVVALEPEPVERDIYGQVQVQP